MPAMSIEDEARTAAQRFRTEHHLGHQPLDDLIVVIEQTTGFDVAVLEAPANEHGLTIRDAQRDIIFVGVARTQNPMRQRSTLAHELAHIIFQDWDSLEPLSKRTRQETRADAFARHLLIPSAGITEVLGEQDTLSEHHLSALVERFQVSPAIAAIALHVCGHIDTPTKERWQTFSTRQLATRYGWLDYYRGLQNQSDMPRPPRRLLARAIEGYVQGVVSLQTVATLRGIPAEQVEQEFIDANIFPQINAVPSINVTDLPNITLDLSDLDELPESSN